MNVDFVDDSYPTKNLYFRWDDSSSNPCKDEDSVNGGIGA
jgi:hypothetical protein